MPTPILDQYSTSQTDLCFSSLNEAVDCAYNAPLICFPQRLAKGEIWRLERGNCHHWDCPRCGVKRAKKEYWRIVNGATALEKGGHSLYFLTVTCRGRELKKEDSEAGYLEWTNRLNTNMRTAAKRNSQAWHYVAVTERQKRGHPHSHYITTFLPKDSRHVSKKMWITAQNKAKLVIATEEREDETHFESEWLQKAVVSAGLGAIHDLTKVRSAAGVSRYVAKYLFKDTLLTEWPKGWKRVRYSQEWPKSDEFKPDDRAFPVIEKQDWYKVNKVNAAVITSDDIVWNMATHRGVNNVYLYRI